MADRPIWAVGEGDKAINADVGNCNKSAHIDIIIPEVQKDVQLICPVILLPVPIQIKDRNLICRHSVCVHRKLPYNNPEGEDIQR